MPTRRAAAPEDAATPASRAGGWASSLRFSGFTVLIVALLVIGALVVSPTLSAYVQQQRELAELRESVQLHREAVAEVDAERVKWQDPAYVRAQARGRLFYVMPGEIQLSVIDDVVVPADSAERTSDQLTQIEQNWARTLVASTLQAGTTAADPAQLVDRLLRARAADEQPVIPLAPQTQNSTAVAETETMPDTETTEESAP